MKTPSGNERPTFHVGDNVRSAAYGVGVVKEWRHGDDGEVYCVVQFLDHNVPQIFSARGEWIIGKPNSSFDLEHIPYNGSRVTLDRWARDAIAFLLGLAAASSYLMGLH